MREGTPHHRGDAGGAGEWPDRRHKTTVYTVAFPDGTTEQYTDPGRAPQTHGPAAAP